RDQDRRDRQRGDRATFAVRRGGRTPRRGGGTVGGVGDRRGLRAPPWAGLRRRPGDHRSDQGPGADLEEGRGPGGDRRDPGLTGELDLATSPSARRGGAERPATASRRSASA